MGRRNENRFAIAFYNLAPIVRRLGAHARGEGTGALEVRVAHYRDRIVANGGGGALLADEPTPDYADPHRSIIPLAAAVGRDNSSQRINVSSVEVLNVLVQGRPTCSQAAEINLPVMPLLASDAR